ncbi:bifunctional diguanylate cyclase/phosphodiesterase [Pelagibacterium sediminicola]|uniref:bifunctional diguanylate cyclase/phosphodiesterase n=1 Tax=Pelagibacterium sediminicola TaxID=2248761 RepID=UPI00319EACAE
MAGGIPGALRRFARKAFHSSNIPTAIALIVMVAAMAFAEMQNRSIHIQTQRNEVLAKVGLVRAQLEGMVNSNIQLVHGLVSTIATEPDMSQERFSALAGYLFAQKNQLNNLAAAPGFVLELMYPVAGNEAAIGLDYTAHPEQSETALRARDTGEMILAGPVHLVQDGRGFIARFPVFVDEGDGPDRFWGIVSAVIDADRLYAESGLLDLAPDLRIAVAGVDGALGDGRVFFGDAAVLEHDPVIADVTLPTGRWLIAATPGGGWGTEPPNTWALRLIMAAAAALVLVPIILASYLNTERRRRLIEQRRREVDLARLSRRLELALETSQVGVWEMNVATGEMSWDDRMNELYGVPGNGPACDYDTWRDRIVPEDVERAEREFHEALRTGERYVSSFRIMTPDGQLRHIRAIGALYQDQGAAPRILGVNIDATSDALLSEALMRAKTQAEAKNFELETAKARIEHNALHDPLTGLPNRRYLDDVLEMHARRVARVPISASILHVDLDRFKQINDTLGHAAGDAMLIHAAGVLKSAVRQSDFVARIGGDEFVVFCLGEKTDDELRALADRIIAAMRRPVTYQGHECRFGVSIGIASSNGTSVMPKQVLVNADIALYRAKKNGRNRSEFFSDELQAEIVTAKRVADDILAGLDNGEFVAFYQPQFDAVTLDIIGVEALARWNHPLHGLLAPDAFMPIAEDINVVATLDRLILEQSLAQRGIWDRDGVLIPRISVNVSARRLNDEGLIKNLKALDIAPGSIAFELVESIYLDESDGIVSWNIDQIKELGIDIEIDDFGTGYASILSLMQLRPKRLKIDRQLVMPITVSHEQRTLVQSMIDIGATLGISAIAEGVESREHAKILADMGCAAVQGYAFARPMAADDITAFVRAAGWRNAG